MKEVESAVSKELAAMAKAEKEKEDAAREKYAEEQLKMRQVECSLTLALTLV